MEKYHYELEKWVWSTEDFDVMGWKGSSVLAMAFQANTCELVLDINYICKAFHPEPPDKVFAVWAAPATLVFQAVTNLKVDFEYYSGAGTEGLEISELEKTELASTRSTRSEGRQCWCISGYHGDIEFESSGFQQFIRSMPVLNLETVLDLQTRGGYSFHRGRNADLVLPSK